MPPKPPTAGSKLAHEVLRFQVKLWLEALRDVVLSPVTLGAAALDLVLLKRQPPRYFRALLALGRRSEDWIDLWAMVDAGAKGENVDALLGQLERVVRDPRVGARRARMLMRYAERALGDAARNARHARTTVATPPPVPEAPPAPPVVHSPPPPP